MTIIKRKGHILLHKYGGTKRSPKTYYIVEDEKANNEKDEYSKHRKKINALKQFMKRKKRYVF